jgi:SNF2 family DNA or RNA helicase
VGHGLNLQAITRQIVWVGLPWSLELYEQTNARAWRQGQNRRVFVHHVMAANTIDQTILGALQSKQDVQQQLMEALLA